LRFESLTCVGDMFCILHCLDPGFRRDDGSRFTLQQSEGAVISNVVKVVVGGQEQAIVLNGSNGDLAVDRRGGDALGCAFSVELRRSDVIGPPKFDCSERSEEFLDPVKLTIGRESLKYFLQYRSGYCEILIVLEQLLQHLHFWMGGRSTFPVKERPHGCVYENGQPRFRRSAL